MSVTAISGVRPAAIEAGARTAAPSGAKGAPALTEPAMSVEEAAGFAAGFDGLGVEALAAMLSADAAQAQAKAAREEERAKAKEEHGALERQVHALREKADDMRDEASVQGAIGASSAFMSCMSLGANSALGQRTWGALADTAKTSGAAAAKAGFGGEQADRDADATQASADAKAAGAARDEAAARRKAAEDAVQKAQSALVEFVQERAMAKRGIFRG